MFQLLAQQVITFIAIINGVDSQTCPEAASGPSFSLWFSFPLFFFEQDSPINKLLYARDIPRYKQMVERWAHI